MAQRDLVAGHAHCAPAALTVAAFSLFAGVWNTTEDTDESSDKARKDEDMEEDPYKKTDAYRRFLRAAKEVEREREAYNKTMSGEKAISEATYNDALDQEGMEDDQAMRARFEDWMKEYGRTYPDEEKARRFKIFKSVARFVDMAPAVAAEFGTDACFGLNDFADRSKEELPGPCCTVISDDEYISAIKAETC